ncbi:fumarylacetoacetate hydrolase family protein [Sansalvadorimonas sp. 2012CJ34-2]|uniref:Fumarylacetoacetate hydrolase family protein n=1 Tax=Parendozoicomonas callyspongiae TaxID=2942213 RepID=A0ABT0PBB6_9GAMM|nr:fumarylacetoacetate hydrolase family protein [Sansalvadorimonas sp. 2012CJ34-2]MCL6268501.1 fumarylacetoacetate hydrolase family protein [Sansalvadorimonas sp. 2012CJ34-2]
MKLASLKAGRDGHLAVVSKDLTRMVVVPDIACTLQQALDNWKDKAPKLQKKYERLNSEGLPAAEAFDVSRCTAPLPRAYQWLDGSAYVNHVELVRKARGAEMPESFWTDPLMYQGGSDQLLGPQDDIPLSNEEWGIDFEAEVVVVTNDVPMGICPNKADKHIVLFGLVNDVSLRNLIPGELGKGFGFMQSKPASSFSPVFVTPDELGDQLQEGMIQSRLFVHRNGDLFGRPDCATDMTFNFPKLVAHAARTRHLAAGTIIGSGTVSNCDHGVGSCCIAERRMLEIIEEGEAKTPFMDFGEQVRIEMFDREGQSIFGAIDQQFVHYAC